MHQTRQSGWEKCKKFKKIILKSNPHWYLHWICISIFDTNSSKHLNVDTEAHAMTPEPCWGRKCSQSLPKSQRSGCLCSAQDSASLTPQPYNLTGPFSPLPLSNIPNTINIHLHVVFPASPTWHSRHTTLTAGTCPDAETHVISALSNATRPLILDTNISTGPSSIRKLPEWQDTRSNELCHPSAFRREYSRKYNSTCL